MKLIIRNLGILLALSVMFSCHKSKDDNATKLRISRIVRGVDSEPAGKRIVVDFVYDDQQRVDKLIFSEADQSTGTLILSSGEISQYSYNGTEKNPFKSSYTPNLISLGIGETYFSFNNAGQVISDSSKFTGNSNSSTREYTYSTDKILVKKSAYYAGSMLSQLTDTFVIKNNNLAEVYYGNASPAYNTTKCYKCTYDNKINPVNKLNIAAWMPVDGITGFPSYLAPGVSKNNIIEYTRGTINYQGTFIAEQTTTMSYTYNADGFPETCIMKTDKETYTVTYYYE